MLFNRKDKNTKAWPFSECFTKLVGDKGVGALNMAQKLSKYMYKDVNLRLQSNSTFLCIHCTIILGDSLSHHGFSYVMTSK